MIEVTLPFHVLNRRDTEVRDAMRGLAAYRRIVRECDFSMSRLLKADIGRHLVDDSEHPDPEALAVLEAAERAAERVIACRQSIRYFGNRVRFTIKWPNEFTQAMEPHGIMIEDIYPNRRDA